MVALPAAAALISLACALVVAWDGWRRPKPDKAAWAVAFALFALAAGVEVAGSTLGWTPLLARVYYLAGAVLVVGFLALGELYLLAPRRVAPVGPGAALLVTALAATIVLDAPMDQARLGSEGWEALERGPGLKALAIGINAGGTLILVGGALSSAWRLRRMGTQRHRTTGCLLIAFGTLLVAAGGTLTRLGHREYLYIAMAVGVAVIFGGYLVARRPDAARASAASPEAEAEDTTVRASPRAAPVPEAATARAGRGGLVPLPAVRGGRSLPATVGDPAIAFLEAQFLPLDDAALAQAGRVWSVERAETDCFGREEAKRVWALRLRLSPAGQAAFDAHGVAARLQLAELYHEVLAPGVAELEAARRAGSGSG